MVTKTCAICSQAFEAVQYKEKYCSDECYKEARRRQARTPEQRARGARKKQRQRARNPEHQRQLWRESRLRHIDERKADNQRFYAERPTYRRDYTRKYRALHPNRTQEHTRYYQGHKAAIAARVSAYTNTHPDVLQLKNSRRRALKKNAGGDWTRAQFLELCGACDWRCAYCHERFGRLTPDHIQPLSRGGSNDIDNIIPACGPCNYSKQDKTPLEYLTRFLP